MKHLTNREEEIMEQFWDRGPLFINDILKALGDLKLHYNTVSTVCLLYTSWCYRYFECRGGGCLAAVTSVRGLRGSRTAPSYAASKAYQINYLESLRQKACRQKLPIRVVDIRPGSVRTAMMKGEGHFWIASPQRAAQCICRAVRKGRSRCV